MYSVAHFFIFLGGNKYVYPLTLRIEKSAFEDCKQLQKIALPNQVRGIGPLAFHGCSSLTSIIIPQSTKTIGENAFCDCKALANIVFLGTKADWNAIKKGKDWDSNTGAYVIHCTDGDIEK